MIFALTGFWETTSTALWRQSPKLSGLEFRLCAIFIGQLPIPIDSWPRYGKLRIVLGYTALQRGIVAIRCLVEEISAVAEHAKTVGKAWRDPELVQAGHGVIAFGLARLFFQ